MFVPNVQKSRDMGLSLESFGLPDPLLAEIQGENGFVGILLASMQADVEETVRQMESKESPILFDKSSIRPSENQRRINEELMPI